MSAKPEESRLPAQITVRSKRVRELLTYVGAHLNAIRSLTERAGAVPAGELSDLCGAAKMDVIGALAELNALDTCMAAARMTGQVQPDPGAADLELHPVQMEERERQLMLASLHRAGDHTLEEEAAHG